MWQQSGTLLFDSCHGIAGFLVDELQIWIWRHFLEVLPKGQDANFFFKKELIIFVKDEIKHRIFMSYNQARVQWKKKKRLSDFGPPPPYEFLDTRLTITNIKHGRRLSLQLMTNYRNAN